MSARSKIIKFRATPEQSKMLTAIYGSKGQRSANMLRTLLDPSRKIAPVYRRCLAERITAIETSITRLLQAHQPIDNDNLTAFVTAAYAGIRLIEALEKHAA